MSTIYYCDASGCNKKEPGRPSGSGWAPPDGWSTFPQNEDVMDACSPAHQEAIIAANTPEEEPEEEAEAEAEES
jgi:hypothetical protein